MPRLDALISNSGAYSRSEARELVRNGRVAVNGIPVKDCAARISETDAVTLDGEPYDTEKYIYIMMNKPAGYISATEGEKNVLELIPPELFRKETAPVGRLDKDTEGLLLLTNDGNFAHSLTAPNKKVVKVYRAELERAVTQDDIKAFAEGITLRDGTEFKPAVLQSGQGSSAFIEISEGKYHQVKLMFSAVGNKVMYLERLSIGGLSLDPALGRGQCLRLSREALEKLR